jgi:catechol 2,3-dioxygenase-like lactoylglutathione lyase family enzyme
MLPTPRFHHLHLNSRDPERAIAFYTRQFASTAGAEWGGFAALRSPNDVLILFTRVETPPPRANLSQPTRRGPRSNCCRSIRRRRAARS